MNGPELVEQLAALPELEPPEAILDQWHATLAELPGPVRRDPRHSRRRFRWAALAAVTTSAAAGLLVLTSPAPTAPPSVESTGPPPAHALTSVDPTRLGELDDPERLRACLSRRVDPHSTLLAARRITWTGTVAVQLVLSSPTLGRLRVLVVTPDCATVLSDAIRGR